jgi:hypothetical protein
MAESRGSLAWRVAAETISDVTGLRFYSGDARAGEIVVLARDPGNAYDANALKVQTAAGAQIGHVPRETAARLAPLVDGLGLRLRAQLAAATRLPGGGRRTYLSGASVQVQRVRAAARPAATAARVRAPSPPPLALRTARVSRRRAR